MPETNCGIVIVYTGNGKGKTTAGLGQALRASGQGLKVCVIQFIKGKWQTGEAKMLATNKLIEFHTLGSGFTWESDDKTAVVETARKAWAQAEKKIMSDDYDMVILDELTYLISYNIISEESLLKVMAGKPARLHLVITGRDASPALIDAADLVTEMKEIKHPYKKGIKAQKGIEF